jgi:glycosyltransferase involved in cell wall biosynthesis
MKTINCTSSEIEETRKLKVLLMPDLLPWVLGTWAKQIANIGTTHNYYLFSEQLLWYYPEKWNLLLNTVDVVHFLNHWEVKSIEVPKNLARINSITHVTNTEEWEDQLIPLTKSDALVVISEEWLQFLLEKGLTPDYIHLFNIGVDTNKFYPFQDKFSSRKRLGINSNSKLIGYSAKFTSNYGERKGIDIFLNTLEICADLGYKFGVLITGPGWNEVVQRLQSYGIAVHYCPFLPDRLMPTLYNALDIYISTARVEGGPAPILESMACGTPVVATPVGIVKDHLTNNVDALIVPKNDAKATAQAVIRLLESSELRDKLTSAALQTITEKFKWKYTLDGIEELYTKVWEAKAYDRKKNQLTIKLNPEKQRHWAITADSYIWHRQLYKEGYYTEGFRGMLESSLKIGGKETAVFLYKTLSTIKPAFIHNLRKRL